MRISLFLLILSLSLCLSSGCGNHARLAGSSDPAPATEHHGKVSLDQMLSELDRLQAPQGANAATFAQIKQAARSMLLSSSVTKFASHPPQGPQNVVQDLTQAYTDAGDPGVQWNYRNVGDYDFNGETNISDVTQIGVHYGKTSASPDWDDAQFADGDGNGEVNISDLTPIGANLMSSVRGWELEGSVSPDGPWSPIGEVSRQSGGRRLTTGMLIYIVKPDTVFDYYRVAPLDFDGNRGVDSNVSVQFIISKETEVIGADGGPQFASRSGDTVHITLPGSDPTSIALGDIIVGGENGGYLLRVDDVQQNGTDVTVQGSPAAMADVFIQGGIGTVFSQSLSSATRPYQVTGGKPSKTASNPPLPDIDFDIGGQVVHDDPALHAEIQSGTFNYLRDADVAINYNRYGGVTYLRALLKGQSLKLKMDVDLSSPTGFNGTFPASEAERLQFEKLYTSLTFSFVTQQNGVPVAMAMEYDIYLGVEGSGDFQGDYFASMDGDFQDVLLGGIFDLDNGIEEHSEYTPLLNNTGTPDAPTTGGDYSFRFYVRPEVHAKLYGNPVPGNSEDLDLRAIPFVALSGARTTKPSDGFNYHLDSGMDTSYKMQLNQLGLASQVQQNFFPGPPQVVNSGFVPDVNPPAYYNITGTISEPGFGPKQDITVLLTDSVTGDPLGSDITDVNGVYDLSDVIEGASVKVTPVSGSYDFTPPSATLVMDGDKVQDFTAIFQVPS